MKRTFLFPIAIILLLAGCGPQENPGQLKAVTQSLERVNDIIRNDNKLTIEKLIDKRKSPITTNVGEVWLPRANRIHQYADSIMVMIKDVKNELIEQSDSLKREYVTVVKHLAGVNGAGGELFKKLTAFKDSIPLVIDANHNYLFQNIPLLPGYRDSLPAEEKIKYEKKWLDESFGRSSSLMAMLMLSKLENDVLATEKMFVEYCYYNTMGCGLVYNQFSFVAFLTSRYVKKGQTIIVKAGVGSITAASKPTISIDGKEIPLNGDEVTIYNLIANGSPGKHTIPVKFEYFQNDGSKVFETQELEYIIADEK